MWVVAYGDAKRRNCRANCIARSDVVVGGISTRGVAYDEIARVGDSDASLIANDVVGLNAIVIICGEDCAACAAGEPVGMALVFEYQATAID